MSKYTVEILTAFVLFFIVILLVRIYTVESTLNHAADIIESAGDDSAGDDSAGDDDGKVVADPPAAS